MKIRVAVAINEFGKYVVFGQNALDCENSMDDEVLSDNAKEQLYDFSKKHIAYMGSRGSHNCTMVHFVEFDIPVPKSIEVKL